MNSRNMKNYAQSVEIFPAQSVEISNERRISTTQVDEALKTQVIVNNVTFVKFTKDFARHIEANERCDICGKFYNFTNTLQ